jgi:thymidylate synthase (FAD)
MKIIGKPFKKGMIPWNKGLTKKTSKIVAKISLAKVGKKRLDLVGNKFRLLGKGNWKGGITEPNQLERSRFRQTMQKLVLERDNYICQLCGQKGGELQVDHIQSWKDYVELRFSMENCRTLCKRCHYKLTYNRPMPGEISWGRNFRYTIGKGVN